MGLPAVHEVIPRMQVFEIDDQTWFPSFLRAWVQDGLREVWNFDTSFKGLTPSRMAASILIKNLGTRLSSYTFVDFCSGGGGPTPYIAHAVNAHLKKEGEAPVTFVLTDLHPNINAWEQISKENEHVTYDARRVDASKAPQDLMKRSNGKKVMRTFNLAFHHFDDALARDILRDTVQTSDGFAIFEMQDRSINSFLAVFFMGIVAVLVAPYFAWKWRSWMALFYAWVVPVIPFVMFFDGLMSSLRTRTPEEVEVLLRTCGADAGEWEMKSGKEVHLWPFGYLHWTICRPRSS